jgi:hypothetical protein
LEFPFAPPGAIAKLRPWFRTETSPPQHFSVRSNENERRAPDCPFGAFLFAEMITEVAFEVNRIDERRRDAQHIALN